MIDRRNGGAERPHGERQPGLARLVVATTLLCVMGGLITVRMLHLPPRPSHREEASLLTGLVLMVSTTLGLVTGRWWGRWLGLALGIFCCFLGGLGVLAQIAEGFASRTDVVAVATMSSVGPLLLACLSGRAMFDRYDRPAGHARGARPSLVRWAVITNLSSVVILALLSFAALEPHSPDLARWRLALACALLVLGGVVLLARGKTVGLLLALVAASTEVILAVSINRVGERAAVGLLLAPGFLLIVAAAVAYVAPIWRFLRAR
jgi:hypothetical protein